MCSTAARRFSLSHIYIYIYIYIYMDVDFSRKMKCWFVANTDCWEECFIFRNMVHHVPAKSKTYHPDIWCYVLQLLQSVRPDSKAFSKNFSHTWLRYMNSRLARLAGFLAVSSPSTVPALALGPPELYSLQMQPAFTHFSYHFLIGFAVRGSVPNFLPKSCQTLNVDFVEWNSSTQNAFSG
jgi:hypothetical protein